MVFDDVIRVHRLHWDMKYAELCYEYSSPTMVEDVVQIMLEGAFGKTTKG